MVTASAKLPAPTNPTNDCGRGSFRTCVPLTALSSLHSSCIIHSRLRCQLIMGRSDVFMTHVSAFKALHAAWASLRQTRSIPVLYPKQNPKCLSGLIQKCEHLSVQWLEMFQLSVPAAQIHCPKSTHHPPKAPQLLLQSLVRNKQRDSGHSDLGGGQHQRQNWQKPNIKFNSTL